jgi:hypothetical protein
MKVATKFVCRAGTLTPMAGSKQKASSARRGKVSGMESPWCRKDALGTPTFSRASPAIASAPAVSAAEKAVATVAALDRDS